MHLRNLKSFALEEAKGYYDKEKIQSRCALSLRKASSDRTETLLIVAEGESDMDILEPVSRMNTLYVKMPKYIEIQHRDFRKLFPLNGVQKPEELSAIKGHNHISVPFGLGLGGKEDAWEEELVEWMRSRVTVPVPVQP